MGVFLDSKLSQDTSHSLKLNVNKGKKFRLNAIFSHCDKTLKP